MTLSAGRRLGPYEIVAPLGAGGMGEVYRARDRKLNRDVALKVLPEPFALDADRLARFKREAQVLASLNHPNIGIIHGLEDTGGVTALVLELVEGPTLADRIAEGRIPLDEALHIARQIAEALEAAHEQGIVHRDLKPANVKLRPDGTVKVLDFGLAKAHDSSPNATDMSQSPTITSPAMTQMGVILGTAAYMAPEQAKGRAADKRSDIWAFGCVLYEMLTGRRAFHGEDVSDTLAFILTKDPEWIKLPANTPGSIRKLLRRCLEKDRKRRLADVADARLEIDEALTAPDAEVTRMLGASRGRRTRIVWSVAGVLGVLIVIALVPTILYIRRAQPESLPTRFEIVTPPTGNPTSFALSPDGRQLAFVATAEGGPRLWVRPLDRVTAQALAGTEDAGHPFWAPDGRAIGFFADRKLKRIDLATGSLQVLADAPADRGGTWSRDGVIVFAPTVFGPLMRVAATGGAPAAGTRFAAGQGSHRWPQFLPDGRRFLFFMGFGNAATRGVYVGTLEGGEPTRVLEAETAATYAPPGALLLVRQGVLVALGFDQTSGVVSGEPIPVAQAVGSDPGMARGTFAVSANGVLAHRAGGGERRQLVWVDRAGTVRGTLGPPDENALGNPELAPDGRRVAVQRAAQGNVDVWLLEIGRGVPSRFTFDASADGEPLWSPDGRRVAFRSSRNAAMDLFEKPASGAADEQSLLVTAEPKTPLAWSPDGRVLLYVTQDPNTGADLWALPVGESKGERKPFPVLQTPFDETAGQFSPDGHWLAYTSNESGSVEVYVRPFAGPGGNRQVSIAGGNQPRWRPDGKELFYIAPDGRLMAASIAVGADKQTLETGTPVPLFATRLASGAGITGVGALTKPQYAVAPDGRFLMNVAVEEATAPPITVVLNWDAGLKK